MEKATKLRTALVGVPVAAGTFLATTGAVSAAPPDPGGTGAAMGDTAEGTVSWVTNFGIPGIVSVLLVGVGIALLIKFTRKARGAI